MLNRTKVPDDFLSFIAHPLANMFPMIEGNAFEELKRDISSQGILEPIRLYQGMILDGRNRYERRRLAVTSLASMTSCNGKALSLKLRLGSSPQTFTAANSPRSRSNMVKRNPSLSDREIARQIGVSNSTVGAARDRLTNSPEVRRYEQFKSQWKKFSDAECMAFIRDNLADIKFLVAEVSKSNGQNPMT
jgi:hypothetical protein